MTRLERALELRDAALAIVKARGSWQGEKYRHFSCRVDGLSITYTTPLQSVKYVLKEEHKYAAAFYGSPPYRHLPFGIDVWAPGGKVLNITWGDAGEVHLSSYKRGDWEIAIREVALLHVEAA